MPKISILCLFFNHAKFVKDTITSILNQTFTDFELVAIDDCSKDNTVSEIEKFNDKRIKLIKHEYNKGINAAINTAFKNFVSDLILFLAGDDQMEPNCLEEVVKYFDNNKNVNVFYQSLKYMNYKGELTSGLFINDNNNKYQDLKDMFLWACVLRSPGLAIRRQAFEKEYPLPVGLCQYQDYVLNVQLLLKNEIYKSKNPLIRYRVPTKKSGISARVFKTLKREELEGSMLLEAYLNIDSVDLLVKIFGDDVYKFGEPIKETIPYFIGRLALLSNREEIKRGGYQIILKFINNNFDLLNKKYGFEFKDYINLVENFENDYIIKRFYAIKRKIKYLLTKRK